METPADESAVASASSGAPSRRRRVWRWVLRTALGIAVLLALFLSLTGMGRYLARAGWEEAKILWARRPIGDIVADSTVPAGIRRKLGIVLDARAFASDSLGLDVGESFTTFTQLERDTLVLVLSAAYQDRLRYYRWWFPIVGRVPYKGYFDFGMARDAERDFRERGFDTYLRPASAFSTLGFFNDPLLSTTLRADSLQLANTVIHELLHNTFYARGKAEFNESFANFVGARGSAEFYRSRGQERMALMAEARWWDEKLLARFWRRLHDDVDSVFKAHPGDSLTRVRVTLRDSVYRAARNELVFRLGPRLRTVSPRALERMRLDNAALLARRIYLTDLDVFDSVYVREGSDTRRAVERLISLAESEQAEAEDPIAAIRSWLARTPLLRDSSSADQRESPLPPRDR